jgi:predicted ArsR family transcriptional regulator
MRGRKPQGPEMVRRLSGDTRARQRLECILATLAGRLSVAEASARLGITPQRFHMLREEALQAALAALAPQPMGRPPKAVGAEPESSDALQRDHERLQRELAASKLREEIALLLPGRLERGEKKRPSA